MCKVITMSRIVPYPVPIYIEETAKLDPFTILRKALHQTYFSKSNVDCVNMTTMIKGFIENVVIPHQLHLIQQSIYVLIGLSIALAIFIALIIKFRKDEDLVFLCCMVIGAIIPFLILWLHFYFSGLTHLHDLETITEMLEKIIVTKTCHKELIAKAITIIENW